MKGTDELDERDYDRVDCYDDWEPVGHEDGDKVCPRCACYPGDTSCYCWHQCSGCGALTPNEVEFCGGNRCFRPLPKEDAGGT